MEKKSKVKEVKNLNKKDDFGNNNFIVSFENNDSGFFKTKDATASQFKVGEEITYILEEKPKKDNSGNYVKISLPKPAFAMGGKGGGFQQMSIDEYILRQKVDSVGYAMSYASKQAEAKIIETTKVTDLAKEWLEWMYMQFDQLLLKNKS